jgi:hypothetical protein
MASLTSFWPDGGMTHTHEGHDGGDLTVVTGGTVRRRAQGGTWEVAR